MQLLLLPNQLFKTHEIDDIDELKKVYLWYHPKFFTDYKFHKNKLHFHYATLDAYCDEMKKIYNIEQINKITEINKKEKLYIYDPTDFEIEKQIKSFCNKYKIELVILPTKLFLLTRDDLAEYMNKTKKPYFNHTFYIYIRNKTEILMHNNKPVGGSYSYDIENRLPYKSDYKEKKLKTYTNKFIKKATNIVNKNHSKNPGEITTFLPVTRKDAEKHFKQFLSSKLKYFGPYEDAFDKDVLIGYHSCISALLNIGLLDINDIIDKTLKYSKKHNTPIQSVEGFIRQLISWREYVRLLYIYEHNKFNKMNFFKHTKKISQNWYTGTTGMVPVDNVIKKVLNLSYAHHIERLMILCNFALLTEIKPKDIYKWFLELVSIDAYEWVMEPNVYGMGIHSVGTLMMNRPYFSSSNYLFKMSPKLKKDKYLIKLDNEEYEWSDIWDALYYNFIYNNKIYLKKIYSTATSVMHLNKKSTSEINKIRDIAKKYLKKY